MEFTQLGSLQSYIYFVVQDLEIDTMAPNAEFPVLFATDKRKLFGFNANLLEILAEWTGRDSQTFIDYLGTLVFLFVFLFVLSQCRIYL